MALLVAGCTNDPYPEADRGKRILYSSFSEAPKTLEDIVKPEYRGKLVMPHPVNHTLTTQWLASLDKIMPKPRAEKFIHDLAAAKPIYRKIPGWKRDITNARNLSDLPAGARKYVDALSELVGVPVAYISVGPDREHGRERETDLRSGVVPPVGGVPVAGFGVRDDEHGVGTVVEGDLGQPPGRVLPEGDDVRRRVSGRPAPTDHPVGGQRAHGRARIVSENTGVACRPAGGELRAIEKQRDHGGRSDRSDQLGHGLESGQVLAQQRNDGVQVRIKHD